MRNFKEESLEIIESLLDTISWLGGDSYEVECAENMTRDAYAFLEKHKPKAIVTKTDRVDSRNGLYCLYNDKNRIVEAVNARNAANILGVGKSKVVCLIIPGTKLKPSRLEKPSA